MVLLILQAIRSKCYIRPRFTRKMECSMVHNFIYANEVVSCVHTVLCGDADGGTQDSGAQLFDIYLLEECYVGRHKPSAVI